MARGPLVERSPVHGACPRFCPRLDFLFRPGITRKLRQSSACPRVREDRDTKTDTAIEKPLCVFRIVDRYLYFFLVKKKRRERLYGLPHVSGLFELISIHSNGYHPRGQAVDRRWTGRGQCPLSTQKGPEPKSRPFLLRPPLGVQQPFSGDYRPTWAVLLRTEGSRKLHRNTLGCPREDVRVRSQAVANLSGRQRLRGRVPAR